MTQVPQLGATIGTKIGLTQKGHDADGLSHIGSAVKKELAAECQLTYQEVKTLTFGQYPNITPRNKRSE